MIGEKAQDVRLPVLGLYTCRSKESFDLKSEYAYIQSLKY